MLGAHPPIACEKDGVAFDVAVDDALVVQVGQSSQDRQADGRDLLLVHPETARWKNELSFNEDSRKGELEQRGPRLPSCQYTDSQEIFQATSLWGNSLVLFLSKKGR